VTGPCLGSGFVPTKKAAGFTEIVRLLAGDIFGRAGLIDNDVINHS
jgi:hypothetical protein